MEYVCVLAQWVVTGLELTLKYQCANCSVAYLVMLATRLFRLPFFRQFKAEVGLKGSCVSSGRQKRSSCNYVLKVSAGPRVLLGFNLFLLFCSSWCWPWLPKVTPGLHWMLCWQFTEVAAMANNLPYTYGPTPVAIHVSFHSFLKVLTRWWLFCFVNYIL